MTMGAAMAGFGGTPLLRATEGAPAGPPKTNILLIVLDQLRPFELACYQRAPDGATRLPDGLPKIATPSVDRLAARGVTFQQAFSNNPVCTPARSILVSGQYSRTACGMMGNWGAPDPVRNRLKSPTVPELLAQVGYAPVHLGKWHIAVHPALVGFPNHGLPGDSNGKEPTFFPIRKDWEGDNGRFGPNWENGLLRGFFADLPKQPWFCFHNIHLPHSPWELVDRAAMERYAREAVRLRPNVFQDGKPAHSRDWYLKHWHEGKFGKIADDSLPADYDLVDYHRHYYAATTVADAQVGYALDLLRASGQEEHTLVVLTADHGDNLGSHGLFNKETMNEESIRVPLIFAGPGLPRGVVNTTRLASLVDLPATLLALAGVPIPAHFQGRDLSEAVRGRVQALPEAENAVFIEGMQDDIAIRTATHKYVIKMQGGWNNRPTRTVKTDPFAIYDLETDPFEQRDLAANPPPWAEDLRRRLLAWNAGTSWM